MNARAFLVRGLIAGVLAGVIGFAVASTVGESPVGDAIAIEESGTATADHHDGEEAVAAHSHDEEEAVVSRDTQSTWGLATATLVYGVALGGILALVSAFSMGRMGRLGAAGSTGLVVGLGFVSVILLPFLRYPPNPPAVGDPDTIDSRTGYYFLMILLGLAVAVAAAVLAKRLVKRWGTYLGILASVGAAIAVIVAVGWSLPTFDEVPAGFPADLLWEFRTASLLTQTAMWASLGLVLVGLVASLSRTEAEAQERRDLVRAG